MGETYGHAMRMAVTEAGINKWLMTVYAQRPRLFNYCTPWCAARGFEYLCFSSDERIRREDFTIESPPRIPGTMYTIGVDYALRLRQPKVRFDPSPSLDRFWMDARLELTVLLPQLQSLAPYPPSADYDGDRPTNAPNNPMNAMGSLCWRERISAECRLSSNSQRDVLVFEVITLHLHVTIAPPPLAQLVQFLITQFLNHGFLRRLSTEIPVPSLGMLSLRLAPGAMPPVMPNPKIDNQIFDSWADL